MITAEIKRKITLHQDQFNLNSIQKKLWAISYTLGLYDGQTISKEQVRELLDWVEGPS